MRKIYKNISNIINTFFLSDRIIKLIIFFGVALYARQYLFNRSLWLDEAKLSLGIIKLSIPDFFNQPILYMQAAPVGFLIFNKILVNLFGTKEFVLRMLPFICGLISLWLFSLIAKYYLKGKSIALALFVFVINPALIYYSSEVKPYYIDVCVVLFSYLIIVKYCLNKLSLYKANIIGLLGSVLIWFSFPVVFVLFGILIVLLVDAIAKDDWVKFSRLGIIFFYWAISFYFLYIFILHNIVQMKATEEYWGNGYISFLNPKTWLDIFNNILKEPLNFWHDLWFVGLCFLIGGYSFFRQDKRKFFLLFVPLLSILLASGLHMYSCKGRLALFLVPIFILIIINGIKKISLRTGKYSIITAVFLIIFLFYDPFLSALERFIKPKEKEEIRSILSYINDHAKAGDIAYLYWGAHILCEYYSISYNFNSVRYIRGFEGPQNDSSYLYNLNKIRSYSRVWIVFAHIYRKDKPYAREIFLHYLDDFGNKIDFFQKTGSSTYLYNFNESTR